LIKLFTVGTVYMLDTVNYRKILLVGIILEV